MELWGWLIGYVVLFALLHLLLYYYYVRREGDDRSSTPSITDGNYTGTRYASRPDRYPGATDDTDAEPDPNRDRDREFEGETIDCPHCGARNESDQTFTYCWNCISTLRR